LIHGELLKIVIDIPIVIDTTRHREERPRTGFDANFQWESGRREAQVRREARS